MANAIHAVTAPLVLPLDMQRGVSIARTITPGVADGVVDKLASSAAHAGVERMAGGQVSLRQPGSVELPTGITVAGLTATYLSATDEERAVAEKAALNDVQERMPAEEKNSPEVNERIKSDPRFAMLVALMLLIQQMVKTSRDESVAAVNRQLTATVRSGEKTVSGARDQFAGAIAAAAVVASLSAMAAKNTMAGNNKMRTGIDNSTSPANKSQGAMHGLERARAGGPKAIDQRSQKALESGKGDRYRTGDEKEHLDGKGQATIKSETHETHPPQGHAMQAHTQSRAQDFYAKGQAIQATATSIGMTTSSGAEISAASKRAEAQLLDNAARSNGSISSNEDAQVRERLEAGKAAVALLRDINAQMAATADHMVRNV
jgi:hypothetical protein